MPLTSERRPGGSCTYGGLGGEQGSRLAEEAFPGRWCWCSGASFSAKTQGAFDAVNQASLLGWSDSSTGRSVGPASGSLLRTRSLRSCSSCWFFGANFFLLASHSFLRVFSVRLQISQVISPHTECLGSPVWSPCSRRRTLFHADFLFPPQACSQAGHPFLKKRKWNCSLGLCWKF